jgi:hypothetical protein
MAKSPAAPFIVQCDASTVAATARGIASSGASTQPGLAQVGLFHEPGTNVAREFQHPSFTTFEEMYRALPEDSWFDPQVSPSRPVQFQLGAFKVPRDQFLWIYDYEFKIYRQSGLDPGDMVPAEAGRFNGNLGFDVTLSGRRVSHLLYQLDPVPVQLNPQTFDRPAGQAANVAQFNRSTAQSFAATASPGLSLLPVRRERQGSTVSPFTMIARPNDSLGLSVVIFRTITSPITAIEGRAMGYLISSAVGNALIERLRPR